MKDMPKIVSRVIYKSSHVYSSSIPTTITKSISTWTQSSSFILQSSSFILHPSPFILHPAPSTIHHLFSSLLAYHIFDIFLHSFISFIFSIFRYIRSGQRSKTSGTNGHCDGEVCAMCCWKSVHLNHKSQNLFTLSFIYPLTFISFSISSYIPFPYHLPFFLLPSLHPFTSSPLPSLTNIPLHHHSKLCLQSLQCIFCAQIRVL